MTIEQFKAKKKAELLEQINNMLEVGKQENLKLYEINTAVDKLVPKYFHNAGALLKHVFYRYARDLYNLKLAELNQRDIKPFKKILDYAEKDINYYLNKYELTRMEQLELQTLPF